MFEALTKGFRQARNRLAGLTELTEGNIEPALREVRLSLLEADVDLSVVKQFLAHIKEKALGQTLQTKVKVDGVSREVSASDQFIKLCHDELVQMMSSEAEPITWAENGPTGIMMVGLQGSGKTTTAAKLARLLEREGKKPLLVAADMQRPAAVDQLQVLGKQIGIPVFNINKTPVDICAAAIDHAKRHKHDVIIYDTAGRLAIDETLMNELDEIKANVWPENILLVVDAMIGQDAVKTAEAFHDKLQITGVVLTKLDGDARGGAALSIKSVTGKALKFVGVGEKLSDLEPFHPDRAAQRILGMGDVMTLIEKAQDSMEAAEAEKLALKMQQAKFDLEDFITQMRRMRKIGSLESILKLIPGMGGMMKKLGDMQVPEKEIDKAEAIIGSMTKKERREPAIMNASRRERIAKGCGRTVGEVNALIKNFEQMNKMMQQMLGGGGKNPQMPKMPKIPGMPAGYTPPGTKPQPKLSPSMMQNSMAQGMPAMPGMPEMPAGMGGEGKKQLSKKTLAERKKKKENRKQRKKR